VIGDGDFAHSLWDLTLFIDLVMPSRYEWDWGENAEYAASTGLVTRGRLSSLRRRA